MIYYIRTMKMEKRFQGLLNPGFLTQSGSGKKGREALFLILYWNHLCHRISVYFFRSDSLKATKTPTKIAVLVGV